MAVTIKELDDAEIEIIRAEASVRDITVTNFLLWAFGILFLYLGATGSPIATTITGLAAIFTAEFVFAFFGAIAQTRCVDAHAAFTRLVGIPGEVVVPTGNS